MSEKIQRTTRDRRDAAREREDRARARAARNRDAGDDLLARRHESAAELQAAAADAAEHVRQVDVAIEGDQLDD